MTLPGPRIRLLTSLQVAFAPPAADDAALLPSLSFAAFLEAWRAPYADARDVHAKVKVTWLDGRSLVLTDVPADRYLEASPPADRGPPARSRWTRRP